MTEWPPSECDVLYRWLENLLWPSLALCTCALIELGSGCRGASHKDDKDLGRVPSSPLLLGGWLSIGEKDTAPLILQGGVLLLPESSRLVEMEALPSLKEWWMVLCELPGPSLLKEWWMVLCELPGWMVPPLKEWWMVL